MKKKYTVFLLLLTLSVYAQKGKIKETSEKGVYFEQNGEMILVYRGARDGKANSGYIFSYGKDGTIELKGKASVPTFKSPNEVVIVQDAAGNRYWKLIDGTIVKTESAGEVSTLPAAKEASIIKKEEENSTVHEVPIKIIEEKKNEIVIPEKEIALPEKEMEIEIEEANVAEEKSEVETQAPEVQLENEQNLNEIIESEKTESTAAPIPSTSTEEIEKTEVETTPIPYMEEDESKNVEANPTPQQEEVKTVEVDSVSSSDVNSEVSNPSEADAPKEDKTIISTIGKDGIEEIQVIDEEVGDVSDMFEKNYEDMSRKEKKLYKKNEKKLMKQLEKELKN
ncbi:hypothetical protein Ga0061079_101164 [Apibacter mensalis]|uniref:Uncharacterized protein n=1 Tax=Apibacter mensalis TaxID=1586267 RepID=A0A0X3ALT4_9FLAO|nr:hypothetical protein [Apibacter mensalis]CVK15351.1 hypothetical protein Ga0061079_101164 [Apibacter mensalis]